VDHRVFWDEEWLDGTKTRLKTRGEAKHVTCTELDTAKGRHPAEQKG